MTCVCPRGLQKGVACLVQVVCFESEVKWLPLARCLWACATNHVFPRLQQAPGKRRANPRKPFFSTLSLLVARFAWRVCD